MDSSESKTGDARREKNKLVKLYRSRRLSNKLPGIEKLNILGFYSMNTNYEFTDDLSQLRYLKLPPGQHVKFDLKINSKQTKRRKLSTNQVKIDALLKWIIAHRQNCMELHLPRRILEIVSFRGLLCKVMVSPYEKLEGWIICASKFQGRIYLCKYDTPEKVLAEENRTEKEREFCDWGYVFEQFLVSDHPRHPPNINLPTNQNEEFSCVFRTSLGHHNIMFGAEMDGLSIDFSKGFITEPVHSPEKLKEILETGVAKFVELKTSADASTLAWEWRKICRFKSLRWWAQCYMAGIKDVICGYRNNEGIVSKLQTFDVGKLPQLGQGFWDPDVCLDYCIRFLDLVTEHVSSGPDELMWTFIWNPHQPDEIQVGNCDSDSPYFFLHKWFTDAFGTGLKRKAESDSDNELERENKDKADEKASSDIP